MAKGTRYGAQAYALASSAGADLLGANLFELAPGKSAFPRHFHCGIEEAIFVVSGSGSARIGEDTVDVRAGDWISLPAGPDHAHQMTNTGDEPLRYLCISNKARADVVGYPDSNKFAAMASPSNDFFTPPWVRVLFRDTEMEYYDGEETE
jgi:uncharacterized cupin superfamily protein